MGVNDSTAELIGGIIFALLVIALITGIWFVHGRNAKKGKKGAAAGDSSDGASLRAFYFTLYSQGGLDTIG